MTEEDKQLTEMDLRIYGISYVRQIAPGVTERVDPTTILTLKRRNDSDAMTPEEIAEWVYNEGSTIELYSDDARKERIIFHIKRACEVYHQAQLLILHSQTKQST